MKKARPPISLAGSQLGEVRHVCAFFNSDDEEYGVLLPFIKDGFECGDKAVHVVNPDQHRDHLQRLAAIGIDPPAAQQSGQFELRTNTEAYLRDGRFDQDRMLAAFEQMASGNATGGFPLSRICCRMDWAVEDIMRTHPMIIIGGILQQNPFFVTPEEFLREYRQRRARRTVSPSTAA
jgi:hypothetical protein